MTLRKKITRIIFVCVLSGVVGNSAIIAQAKPFNYLAPADLFLQTSVKYKPESFYGTNVSLLNNEKSDIDSIFYVRHTLDFKVLVRDAADEAIKGNFVVRNKAVWGNPASALSTTDSDVKLVECVVGTHKHSIPRMMLWLREGWLDIQFQQLCGYKPANPIHFKLGAFPFSLGRGIALGDAYAVGDEVLGFFSDNIVDQYAFGFDVFGDVFRSACSFLSYDFYGAILQNKSASLSDVGLRIFGQEYDRLTRSERRFGSVNFVVATRVKYQYATARHGSFTIEPYILFNRDPEQRVEFPADARGRLGTLGCAFEYVGTCVDFGIDAAVNVGNQLVKGWDRNAIEFRNLNGAVQVANNKVFVVDAAGNAPIKGQENNAPYLKPDVKGRQAAIFTSYRAQSQNGATIISDITDAYGPFVGSPTNPLHAVNAADRFRDPYTNTFKGWMFASDVAWRVRPGIQLAATLCVASGDENPNFVKKDGDYKGFVPLQEVYSGDRVRTAFLLNGSGKVSRPITLPPEIMDADPEISLEVSNFTNLVLAGFSAKFEGFVHGDQGRRYVVQPDLVFYWQEHSVPAGVNKFLGTEINFFGDYNFTKRMKIFTIGALFVPGKLFKEISGAPGYSAEAIEEFDSEDVTGFTGEPIPGLGHNVAWTINVGIEYVF